ncbi:methionine adenosyltransferase [Ruminococcaceae bacterium OttesenSCG-928-L11]|nr:methionine adenosyltransferase [Ruminococcaceae bacterium OttesenSCG-928-L11]
MSNFLFTSESVTEGHPDKLCDQISDAVLDAYLAHAPSARVACETAAASGMLLIMGEATSNHEPDIIATARNTLRRIGYGDPRFGFDAERIPILVAMNRQSADIALGVDRSLEAKVSDSHELGAGDQGMVFGYACNETEELMPMPIYLAHTLTRRLAEVRKNGTLPWLGPDGKAQVTVEYRDGKPHRLDTVIISAQHLPEIRHSEIREALCNYVAAPVLQEQLVDTRTRFLINPTGRFVTGGPAGDSGLTGRKIIVDTYGGFARHGGGAFSGKDPTKVDRSAAYAARHVAKNLVAAGIADRLELQISYAIGVAQPVSLYVDTFGTGKLPDADILALIGKHFDLRPSAIIERLGLRCPIYAQTAIYGHFGRSDLDLPWERLDAVNALR